ncbi:MAG: SRPBCC domain-containing protein [Armatimonadetes bacterium]|nr:SRPBCC domain-containing protein [Armatimonadota bacterium]
MSETPSKLRVSIPYSREVIMTWLLHAPRDLVWDVITQPEHIEKWWGHRDDEEVSVSMKSDFKLGNRYDLVLTVKGEKHPFRGEYLGIWSPQEVKFTQVYDIDPANPRAVTINQKLEAHDDLTEMIMKVKFESPAALDAELENGMEFGVEQSFKALDQYLKTLVTEE